MNRHPPGSLLSLDAGLHVVVTYRGCNAILVPIKQRVAERHRADVQIDPAAITIPRGKRPRAVIAETMRLNAAALPEPVGTMSSDALAAIRCSMDWELIRQCAETAEIPAIAHRIQARSNISPDVR